MADETTPIAAERLWCAWKAAKAADLFKGRDWRARPIAHIALIDGPGAFGVLAEPGWRFPPFSTSKQPVIRFWAGPVLLEEMRIHAR